MWRIPRDVTKCTIDEGVQPVAIDFSLPYVVKFLQSFYSLFGHLDRKKICKIVRKLCCKSPIVFSCCPYLASLTLKDFCPKVQLSSQVVHILQAYIESFFPKVQLSSHVVHILQDLHCICKCLVILFLVLLLPPLLPPMGDCICC
jgi:hypothetical protein